MAAHDNVVGELRDRILSIDGHACMVDSLYSYKESFKRLNTYLVKRAEVEETYAKALQKLTFPAKGIEMRSSYDCIQTIDQTTMAEAQAHITISNQLKKLARDIMVYKDDMAVNRKKNVANVQILQQGYEARVKAVDDIKVQYHKSCEALVKSRSGQTGTTETKQEADRMLDQYKQALKSSHKSFEGYQTNLGILIDDLLQLQLKAIDYLKESCFEMLLTLKPITPMELSISINEACTRIDKMGDLQDWIRSKNIMAARPERFVSYMNGIVGGDHVDVDLVESSDRADTAGPSASQATMAFDPLVAFPAVSPENSTTLPRDIASNPDHKLTEDERDAFLTKLWRLPGNRNCVDCDAREPTWGSINLGILFCIDCSGTHRSMGVHISKVRSFRLDNITTALCLTMEGVGNQRFNSVFEANLTQADAKITPSTNRQSRDRYIRLKYEKRAFCAADPTSVARRAMSSQASGSRMAADVLLVVRAIEDFEGQEAGDLSFKAGDVIEVLKMDRNVEASWWTGRLQRTRAVGLFPSTFIEE